MKWFWSGPHTLLLIDAAGGTLCFALLAAGLGYGVLKPNTAARQTAETELTGRQSAAELGRLREALAEQERSLADERRLAELGGRLPRATPPEEALGTITEIARKNGLTVTEVTPLSTLEYPGLREQRYVFRSTGAFHDYIRFLREFESLDCLADITQIQLRSESQGVTPGGRQIGQMSLCFISPRGGDQALPP